MSGRRSTAAPISRFPIARRWRRAGGSAPSWVPAPTGSRPRGASMRAAADPCAAIATRPSGRATLNNDPVGGRSLAELSLELRYRFGAQRQFGVVPFIDAGTISADPWPSIRQMRVGAGLGVRYYRQLRADPRGCGHAHQPAARRSASWRVRLPGAGLLTEAGRLAAPRRQWPIRRAGGEGAGRRGCSALSRGFSSWRARACGGWTHRPAIASSPDVSPRFAPPRACASAWGGSTAASTSMWCCADVRVGDPDGAVASIPIAYLDWFPFAWLSNRLDIDRLHIPLARLIRKPKLRPSGKQRPLLPGFDIPPRRPQHRAAGGGQGDHRTRARGAPARTRGHTRRPRDPRPQRTRARRAGRSSAPSRWTAVRTTIVSISRR